MKHGRWLAAALAALLACGALAEGGGENLSADSVYHLELRLADLGYFAGKCDGVFDQETRTALEGFQQANGLEATGKVDEATLNLVNGGDAVSRQAYLEAFARRAADAEPLRQGSSSDEVKVVQSRLKSLGFFAGKADGVFGDATRQAVERFQQANGLEQSGEVDGPTQMRLYAESPVTWGGYLSEMCSSPGDSGLNVYALQRLLADMGYFEGDCTASYGELTQRAVEAFQKANGLEVTGQADTATWSKLCEEEPVALRHWDELQLGDSGARVTAAQARLAELGYMTSAAGETFDYLTETAVRLFQLGNGMEPTGALDGDAEAILLSGDALAAGDEKVAAAWQTLTSAVDDETRAIMAETAEKLLGTPFEAAQDDLYPGFAFVQYVCAAAGLPVLQPETLTALASSRVGDLDEVGAGDVVAFQSASQDSVSIQLAVGAGDGKIYYTTTQGGWVVLGFISQMNSTNAYRWRPGGGGDE